MDFCEIRLHLKGLTAYRELLDLPVLARFGELLDALARQDGEGALSAYAAVFYALRQEGCSGPGAWLWDALRFRESPYGRLVEQGGQDPALEAAARWDVDVFSQLAGLDPDILLSAIADLLPPNARAATSRLPRWTPGLPFDYPSLTHFYTQNGCGIFAKYRAFRWSEGHLLPIPHPDSPPPWALWGYHPQRQQVYDNAQALLEGKHVNHVLLYGDSGTGKSATVKSLLSRPGFEGLRVVEMDKDHLEDIPSLVRLLDGRKHKFILFIDDLAFDEGDRTYSQLKTILEGSLERQRDNVVVYATSNRRNLVRQTFSERLGDDVDVAETLAEKTSLTERFGVRVPYLALSPREFLCMVVDLARIYGVQMPQEELERKARQWELRHPGRTPRVARQFIASLSV